MKTTDLPEPDLKIWASQQLGVPAEASAREARASFLRQLGDHHFVPPPALQESVDWWMRPRGDKIFPSLTEQAFCEEEARLRNQVDDFAREYFLLDPAKRRRRHRVLVEQCAWSLPLSARLERLAGGLDLEAEPWHGQLPPRRDLVEQMCRLFVLPPRERARKRIEVVRECETGAGLWQEAARAIQRDTPELVSLEPFLIDELAWGKARRTSRPRIPKPAAPAPMVTTDGGGGGSKWGYWVVLMVVLFLVRLFTSTSNNPPPAPMPNFNRGDDVLRQQQKVLRDLEEMRKKEGKQGLPLAPVWDPELKKFRLEVQEPKFNLKFPEVKDRDRPPPDEGKRP